MNTHHESPTTGEEDKQAHMNLEPETEETGVGEETFVERVFNKRVAEAIHLFLSLLAVLLLVAAALAAYDTVVRGFPKLWANVDEYNVLQGIVETLLLIAIAAEFGLLLLFRRPSAAVEVMIFVVARKMVSPDVTALDLLVGAAAVSGLIVVRFYYLPGKPK